MLKLLKLQRDKADELEELTEMTWSVAPTCTELRWGEPRRTDDLLMFQALRLGSGSNPSSKISS